MGLFLVVGPSGAGKDTVLREVEKKLGKRVSICPRYITRPPSRAEQNYFISQHAFEQLEQSHFFAATWKAHALSYGIAQRDCSLESNGGIILASVSRDAVSQFESQYPDVTTILVTADQNTLAKRLLQRGRENEQQIEKRLARANKKLQAKKLAVCDNSGNLAVAVSTFIQIIESVQNG